MPRLQSKKSPYDPQKESPRIQELTQAYIERIRDVPHGKIYFVDEMGVGLNLIPSYGRAPSTERAYDTKPTAKGKRISTIGAMNCAGIATALTIEGTLNGQVFLYFVEHFLCPLLREGDHVVIDNATAHKVKGVKTMIEKCGATLVYLPPYSPEFNAIELAWNKIKHYLRKQRARTTKQLHKAYFKALKLISLENAQKFVTHAMGFIN